MVIDALGRPVPLRGRPTRVVSLVPSLSELVCSLGCAASLVGVSDFCVHPAEALAGLPRVGGQKDPDLDRLLGLRPDLVLCAKEENLRRDVLRLEEAGVPVYVTDVRTIEAALALPGELGPILGAMPARVQAVHQAMLAGVEEARRRRAGQRPMRVLVPVWRDPWIVAGPDTYIDAVIALLGADNLARQLPASALRRYPKAEAGALRALAAECVLLPSEPYPFSEADLGPVAGELGAPPRLCDGTVLCWYGPRMARLPELADLLDGP